MYQRLARASSQEAVPTSRDVGWHGLIEMDWSSVGGNGRKMTDSGDTQETGSVGLGCGGEQSRSFPRFLARIRVVVLAHVLKKWTLLEGLSVGMQHCFSHCNLSRSVSELLPASTISTLPQFIEVFPLSTLHSRIWDAYRLQIQIY